MVTNEDIDILTGGNGSKKLFATVETNNEKFF
jgi:hypothetical protein